MKFSKLLVILIYTFYCNLIFANEKIYITVESQTHSNAIRTMFLKNKDLITVSNDKTIKIWDLKNYQLKNTLYGHIGVGYAGRLNYAAYNQNINKLAVSGDLAENQENYEMYKIRIYDMNSNKIYKTIENHEGIVSHLEFTADGKYLIIGFTYPFYHFSIFETKDFNLVNDIKITERYDGRKYYKINKLKIIKKNDDYLVVTVSDQGDIDIYSKKQNKIINSINIQKDITSLLVDKNNIYIGYDKGLEKYDLNLNLQQKVFFEHNLTFMNELNKQTLLICSETVCFQYDKKSLAFIKKIFANTDSISTALIFDENTIITPFGKNQEIALINFKTNEVTKKIRNDSINIYSIGLYNEFLGFSDEFNTNNFNKYVNLNTLTINKLDPLENFKFDTGLSIKNDNIEIKESKEYLLQNTPTIISVNNKKENISYDITKTSANGFLHSVYGIIESDKNDLILSGSAYGFLEAYNAKTGNKIANFNGHNDFISALVKNNKFLFSSSYDGIINAWDIEKIKNLEEKKVISEWMVEKVAEKFGTTKENIKNFATQLYLNYGIDIYKIDIEELFPTFSIYILKENEFVIWTEEGYFSVSSPEVLKYITWHMNQGYDKEAIRYDIGKFYDVFFRPDLVKLKLQGEDISKYTQGLTVKDALKNPPPEVKIINVDKKQIVNKNNLAYAAQIDTKKDNVNVKFNVSDFGGGVGTIRVYQEGKLIKTIGKSEIDKVIANVDTKIEEQEKEKKLSEYQQLALSKAINGEALKIDEQITNSFDNDLIVNSSGDYEINVALKNGLNQISIEAFNKTNTITSFRSTVNINANIPERKPKLYAIVAGVNNFESNYGNTLQNLKYAVNDAKSISDIASKSREKIFDDIEIISLIGNQVTKDNIEAAFENISKKASLEDTILFYISTHGISANSKFYLLPSNNAQLTNLIEFNDIFKKSSELKSLNQIFIIDACQSGSANDIASAVYDSRASVLARSSGIHLLSASTSGTYAFENNEYKHSNFTYHILDSMKNKETDKNKDGFISVIELSDKLRNLDSNEKQFPVIQNIGNDINLNKAY
ncbi:caspase family protein [Aliarcobacter butzleri]|uniref:caspase family protein n=4 Tax=Aliarcobacter butzleri TaxID=28197 RepID=UPI002B244CB7|nr:caspase family protein [Aliarcobacter butzleri]